VYGPLFPQDQGGSFSSALVQLNAGRPTLTLLLLAAAAVLVSEARSSSALVLRLWLFQSAPTPSSGVSPVPLHVAASTATVKLNQQTELWQVELGPLRMHTLYSAKRGEAVAQ
jgi:hypothetical protein